MQNSRQLQERHDLFMKMADQAEAIRHWHESDKEEFSEESYLLSELAERLGVLLGFLADASSVRVMTMRTWCVLYALRPDLINDEPIQEAADRFGVSQQALCEQLKWFKKRTGFVYVSRVGTCSTEKMRKRMQALNAARAAKSDRFSKRLVA